LLIRYRTSPEGKHIARALVYTSEEHRIDLKGVDPDALRIVQRLREQGHESYIVGGAVRDLLLGRIPKDFDIVTDAEPPRIKRIFRNARVIGRRFRLVHVYAGPKIFEVSTFRSIANGTVGNEYGTIDEDALRRDFTCNALYFDPIQAQLVDYVGGYRHIQAKRIVPVIPLKSIFSEDAVRMIRCVKYATTSGFKIPLLTRLAIKRDADLLAGASASRLTEEFLKILGSGKSAKIFEGLEGFGLLKHIVPKAAELISSSKAARANFLAELGELDAIGTDGGREKRLALLIAHFIKAFLESLPGALADTPEAYQEALREARGFLSPLNLPRVELEAAVLVVFKKRGISPRERPRRPGPERGHGLPERAGAAPQGGRNTPAMRGDKGPARDAARKTAKVDEALPEEKLRSRPKLPPRPRGDADQRAAAPAQKGQGENAEPPLVDGKPSTTSGAARRRRRRQRKASDSKGEQGTAS
jgi:poly(A) polymerase